MIKTSQKRYENSNEILGPSKKRKINVQVLNDNNVNKYKSHNSSITKRISKIPENISTNPSILSVNELGRDLLNSSADGDLDKVRMLLSKGAFFTADWVGSSPLHLAAKYNHFDICDVLLKAGNSKDARTKVDKTPLHLAASEGNLNICELLLRSSVDIDAVDLLGMSALHWSAQNGHADCVKILLEYGAKSNLQNKFGLTPVEIALQIERRDIAQLILTVLPIFETQNHEDDDNEDDKDIDEEEEMIDVNVKMEYEVEAEEIDDADVMEPLESGCVEAEIEEREESNSYAESLNILKQHGISMIQNENDNNILTTVMESGHSVVLTDIGKEVLNSYKTKESNEMDALKQQNYDHILAELIESRRVIEDYRRKLAKKDEEIHKLRQIIGQNKKRIRVSDSNQTHT